MATTLYFLSNLAENAPASICLATNNPRLDGTTDSGWMAKALSTVRGDGVASILSSTAAGPTSGVEVQSYEWISEPLAAGLTISGTITFNLRMRESSMSANAGAQCVIERLDHLGAIISTVVNSERGVELGTSEAAQNWTAAPTSTVFQKGDRIRIRVAANDGGGTMASGFSFTFFWNGTTSGASGDSFVTFTEDLTFMTATPTGTTLYLTDVAGPAVGAAIEKEMWTSLGTGTDSIVVNTAAGWTAPIQWTDSAGGTVVEWYTRRLAAFTLAERVLLNLRALESNDAANTGIRAELAVTDNDGTNVTVWAASNFNGGAVGLPSELTTAQADRIWHLAASDLAVTEGQRLRLRVFIDDVAYAAMVTGHTASLFYDSTTANSSSFITLTQSVTEFTAAALFPNNEPARRLRRIRTAA